MSRILDALDWSVRQLIVLARSRRGAILYARYRRWQHHRQMVKRYLEQGQ